MPDHAVGVAIDPDAGKVYWGNFASDTISFAELNNTGGGGELKTTGASPLDAPIFPALLKVPLATATPKIRGSATVGSKLSCSRGKRAPDLIESFLYQRPVFFMFSWSRNGTPIRSARSESIIASRRGTYECTVTAENQAGITKNTSAGHTIS